MSRSFDAAVAKLGDQVQASKDFETLTRNQFGTSERPYVWAPDARYVVQGGTSPIKVKFVLVNYGKSPAMEERGVYDVFFGPTSLTKADDWFNKWRKKLPPTPKRDVTRYWSRNILPPGIPSDITTGGEVSFANSRDIPTPAEANEDTENLLQIVAVSHFQYRDLAGRVYYTNVCYIRFPNLTGIAKGQMAKCSEHNEIH